MSELNLTVKNGEIVITEEVAGLLAQAQMLDRTIKELEKQKEAIEAPLKAAIIKNKIKQFKCDALTATKVDDTVSVSIDKDKMKADGVLDKYATYKTKAGSVKIYYAKEKKNA